jgi:hypothetical protein
VSRALENAPTAPPRACRAIGFDRFLDETDIRHNAAGNFPAGLLKGLMLMFVSRVVDLLTDRE